MSLRLLVRGILSMGFRMPRDLVPVWGIMPRELVPLGDINAKSADCVEIVGNVERLYY